MAQNYLKEAIYFYDRWGCQPKVARLEEKYHVHPRGIVRNIKV